MGRVCREGSWRRQNGPARALLSPSQPSKAASGLLDRAILKLPSRFIPFVLLSPSPPAGQIGLHGISRELSPVKEEKKPCRRISVLLRGGNEGTEPPPFHLLRLTDRPSPLLHRSCSITFGLAIADSSAVIHYRASTRLAHCVVEIKVPLVFFD